MDILGLIRDLLTGNRHLKRKSSLLVDDLPLNYNKKSRISDSNLSRYPNNCKYFVGSSFQNNYSDSFGMDKKKVATTSLNCRKYSNEENNGNSQIAQNASHSAMGNNEINLKKPMPALIPANRHTKVRYFDHRPNQGHQTISPVYNQYGETSELSNFKSIPEIFSTRLQQETIPKVDLTNGHHSKEKKSLSASLNALCSLPKQQNYSTFLPPMASKPNEDTAKTTKSCKALAQPPSNFSRNEYLKLLKEIPQKTKKNAVNNLNVSIQEYIDLTEEMNKTESSVLSGIPIVNRMNTLKERLGSNEILQEHWENDLNKKYSTLSLNRLDSIREAHEKTKECERKTWETEYWMKETLNKISIDSYIYVDDEEDEETPNDFPLLDEEKQKRIRQLINGSDAFITLINKFNLEIRREDIQTLQWCPLTWLNDNVINFYMELLVERSRQNVKLPKVHAMNTFFLQRLLDSGYSGVRRWTRKVDIFAHDIIPIPVHKGIHWCMAIIHFVDKTIKYYDSMGVPNDIVLNTLADYLRAESLDKKKVEFDMRKWKLENVRNIPKQENGSDCGVFSCMYAEFITRNRPIVFTQQNMQYFRMKMVYEICTGKMLN